MKPQNARLAMVFGVSQLLQEAVMLAAPAWFYAAVPGVDETGPFNPHLMRDVGCAFLLVGACLALFAAHRRFAAAGATGAAYLVLHALMHVWDGVAGRERPEHLAARSAVTAGAGRRRAVVRVARNAGALPGKGLE